MGEPAQDLSKLNENINRSLDAIVDIRNNAMKMTDKVHDLFAINTKEKINEAVNENQDLRVLVNKIEPILSHLREVLPKTVEITNILDEIEECTHDTLKYLYDTDLALRAMELEKAAKINGAASDALNPIRELVSGIKAQI